MKNVLTVSQLNDQIKAFLEEAFGTLLVEGEISNLRRPQSGHIYFTLKDDKSQIRAVYFRPFGNIRNRFPVFDLEDGMKIICRARLSSYVPRGEYQLIVEAVEPQGIGALQKAFEQLKVKLSEEGLFNDSRKKNIPYLPERIGIITSPTGAVIQDILNITKRRFPSVNILLAPTRVQGEGASGEIITALHQLHEAGNIDVIIIARGGGSLEDLAPFNDEVLAREIAKSSIPVISAVGHETDFTICDFVADLRAPTPSAAAELVLPNRIELSEKLQSLRHRLISSQQRSVADRKEKLQYLQERFKDPRRFLMDYSLHLDDLLERIKRTMLQNHRIVKSRFQNVELRFYNQNPQMLVQEKKMLIAGFDKSIRIAWTQYFSRLKERLVKNASLIGTLSPLAVLQRGYSITRRITNGKIIRHASQLTLDERIAIQLAQGKIEARVEKLQGD